MHHTASISNGTITHTMNYLYACIIFKTAGKLYQGTVQCSARVSFSLTSPFSTNMAISDTKCQGWRAIPTQWRKASDILTSTLAVWSARASGLWRLSDERLEWTVSGVSYKWFSYGPADVTGNPSSLVSLQSRMVLSMWCQLTQVILQKKIIKQVLFTRLSRKKVVKRVLLH